MEPKETVYLCPACDLCPEVKIYDNHATIGEVGNMVTLNKFEWNTLVEKIISGALGQL
ncbi:MAG: hypothetical protein WBD99_06020 [Thermodesulfobacteriota bacterium]